MSAKVATLEADLTIAGDVTRYGALFKDLRRLWGAANGWPGFYSFAELLSRVVSFD